MDSLRQAAIQSHYEIDHGSVGLRPDWENLVLAYADKPWLLNKIERICGRCEREGDKKECTGCLLSYVDQKNQEERAKKR